MDDTSWYLDWMTKNRNLGLGQWFYMLLIYFYILSHLNLSKSIVSNYISHWNSFLMLNTLTFYHCDKAKARLLGSWLKQWNLLEKGVIVSLCRKRQSDIALCYSAVGDLVYWCNIQELMDELQLEHISGQWRLFIVSSKVSLKAVLHHDGNKVSFYRTGPCSSHERNIREPSRLCCKKYTLKNTDGMYVLT